MKPKFDTEKQKNNVKPVKLDVDKTVKKSNILNEVRNSNASLVEYRLFCVYLAHLSLNKEENVVAFTLADYARIVGLDRPRREDLEAQSANVVRLTALVENPDGGFSNRPVFSDFTLYRDEEEQQWMVSLECHPKLAPLIREQKGRFLRYKLYNTIYLKSFNQMRIYELLKQYEKIGTRTETLEDLRAYLSIAEKEYPVWYDFSSKVLKVAQKALKEHTDIYFEYEPVKKGKKVAAVKFDIFKNEEFIDRLHIEDFAPSQEVAIEYEGEGFEVHSPEDGQEPEQLDIDTQEMPDEVLQEQPAPERDKSIRSIQRQAKIDLVREIMLDCKFEISDGDLEMVVLAAEQSVWWDNVMKSLKGTLEDKEAAFAAYIEAYYVYTKNNSTAPSKNGFISYLTGGVRANYNNHPLPYWANEGEPETEDTYEANLKKMGFDPETFNL